jgi:predicted ATPase
LNCTAPKTYDLGEIVVVTHIRPARGSGRLRSVVGVHGCSLVSAEEVCGADIDTVGVLVDKSMLRTEQRPRGVTHYLSLETIREFALERLSERPEASELHRRHAEHFRALVAEALPGLAMGTGRG